VGVEKIIQQKMAEKTLRHEALQTTSQFSRHFCPLIFHYFDENGVFQHPRLFTTVTRLTAFSGIMRGRDNRVISGMTETAQRPLIFRLSHVLVRSLASINLVDWTSEMLSPQ
jgi:hypothetical protein